MSPGAPPASASARRIVSIVARVCRYMSPGPSTTPPALRAVEPEMNTRSPTRTAREYAYTPSRGPPEEMRRAGGGGAVDGVELDLDQLAGPGQAVDLHQGGGRAGVAEVTGDGAGRGVGHADVGHVDAAADHVGEPAARLAHAPLGDLHDRLDLPGHVALAAHVALAIDGGGARLQHGVPDAERARVVGERLELPTGRDVDAAWCRHAREDSTTREGGAGRARPGRGRPRWGRDGSGPSG